ncbi:MAG: KEOPS complex kinase/ATPase Bud32 [Candidatus Thorarchaeota archaeon]
MNIEGQYIAIGAESTITKIELWGRQFALKRRPSKSYLFPTIDESLRKGRTSRECKALTIARSLGVPTPAVHSIDFSSCTIMMDFIEGKQLKEIANNAKNSDLHKMCVQFGRSIAHLHNGGLVHGDPTTSNLLVASNGRIWMIDFGLAEMNATLEMKGVDLHLIRRALETTHWDLQDQMLESTLEGYVEVIGKEADDILARMEEIRERGRYH